MKESQENQSNADVKVNNLLANIRTLQEEKKSVEAKLTQTQTSYQAQVYLFFYVLYITKIGKINIFIYFQLNAFQQKTEECEQLCEKLTTLEIKISTESDEKSQYEVHSRRNIIIITIYNLSVHITLRLFRIN